MNDEKLKELTKMEWGSFTPEFSKKNEFIHVFNHFISTPEAVERTIRFIINRIKWCDAKLSDEIKHSVVIDDIGQNVSDETRDIIKNAIKGYAISIKFTSKEKQYGI